MSDLPALAEIDVLILCGGIGSRLKPAVSDRPKPMAEISDRPFLDILIDHVSGFGFSRFILCTGYMKDSISGYYRNKTAPVEIVFSEEEMALGTGGALRNAEGHIKSRSFIVMNGDSFCPMNYREFTEFHFARKSVISLALSYVSDASEYGIVECDSSFRVTSFSEKGKKKEGLVNTGIYLMERQVLSRIPAGRAYSLEYDLFPSYIGQGFYGYTTGEGFIDIGTPERYDKARTLLSQRYRKET
ncbi:MAG: galactokinase [Nitrospirae bacterium]|nr:MAG: galactokinase [Nitrospirota bacterium]